MLVILAPFDALACPLDGEPLNQSEKTWQCARGHSFDVARQGYIHLLPVQKKKSLEPGDSKDMIAARQRFLAQGFYDPISSAVNEAVMRASEGGETICCLDAGCGEGYYLRKLSAALTDKTKCALIGNDISKWAVLKAAQQQRTGVRWIVASNANLPIQTDTLDVVLSLFGFPIYNEFSRVLRPGGILIQVDAGPDHLRELREIIYPELKPEGNVRELPSGYELVEENRMTYVQALDKQEQIFDLLAMTPHLYRASAEGKAKAEALDSIMVTVDVILRSFRSVQANPAPNE
ncbi:methyltransferase domain-containing protein [Marinobacter salinisoli]|uniref:Methyltransferase domain-containing protein n=1 Tax=Marinobacter salinisoli TaxID=2769486 RepID=A0ABX7MNJ8_9GAMM|nr:methyltransferase domain-containing protein [Marinobacter salinisoli]QSP93835.1 methyltransferase domain-containing protein [Marinobacter salinisoli]